MFDARIHTAPPNSGTAVLGKTLPDVLYEACPKHGDTCTLNQRVGANWDPLKLNDFRDRAEALALALLDLGAARGDRVGLFMESDVNFCIADMASLIAGLVDVPIYLTHSDEAIQFVLDHAGVSVLFVSSMDHVRRLRPVLSRTATVKTVVVADQPTPQEARRQDERTLDVLAMSELERRGRDLRNEKEGRIDALLAQIKPQDLATIIYTSGTTGVPKGVMLSHENITYDGLTSFSGLTTYQAGSGEAAVSFLPLTHVFARTLHYGYIGHGTSVYFVSPDQVAAALTDVRPTVFATVPRVLEKVYARILERGAVLGGAQKKIFEWSLRVARKYELGSRLSLWRRIELAVARLLVFRKWQAALGGRVRFVISGGAALTGELANVYAAAGIQILQGYGLTETSPVITYNRPHLNRAGTVGVPIPGVEVRIAEDGEVCTRGPHIMLGYYRDEEKTAAVIDKDLWFHTGDIGEITSEGFLRITDRKKDLFKLSTGKYVMPQPLETRLAAEPLVEQAVVTGAGRKFCTALIFPAESVLRTYAATVDIPPDIPLQELLDHPVVLRRFQQMIDKANKGIDPWSTIKRFKLVGEHVTVDNGLLTPTLKVKRSLVSKRFADVIDAMYVPEASEPLPIRHPNTASH